MQLRHMFIAGSAALAIATMRPALAADAATDHRIDALAQQLEKVSQQLADLQRTTADAKVDALQQQVRDLSAQVADLKAGTASRFADTQKQISAVAPTLKDGRPTLTTADGAFSASLRSIVQLDAGAYEQDKPASQVDLSSGSNFRRARFGMDGKLFTDWDYSFLYDFGGSGVEGTSISQAYLQYNGFAPIAIRVGAFPPYANLEDSAGAGDTLFLERASVTEIQRGLAGGDGRTALSIVRPGERFFASLAYTGGQDHKSGVTDEQQALLGRAAYLVYSSPSSKIVLGVNGTSIFRPADTSVVPPARNAPANIVLQNGTELRVDDTGTNGAPTSLVSTGNLNANSLLQWGVDAGANFKSLYAEGGYYRFTVDQRLAFPDLEFDGWYAAASWLITGESRRYDATRAAFRNPIIAHPVGGSGGGWGAWELAVRFSTIDLNDQVFDPVVANRVRGGQQDIWTFGVNWYANAAIRVLLDYQRADIDRRNAAGVNIGQDVDQISARVQYAF